MTNTSRRLLGMKNSCVFWQILRIHYVSYLGGKNNELTLEDHHLSALRGTTSHEGEEPQSPMLWAENAYNGMAAGVE